MGEAGLHDAKEVRDVDRCIAIRFTPGYPSGVSIEIEDWSGTERRVTATTLDGPDAIALGKAICAMARKAKK